MFYPQCLHRNSLQREVVKWLQSLDLSFYPNNVRRDFSSGYLVAEIFSRYYPQDFPKHSYDKGTSLCAKQKNWSRIERVSKRKENIPNMIMREEESLQQHGLYLMKDLVEGTVHCKPGAAELLVQEVYTILTNRSIRDVKETQSDFTDQQYQDLLPGLARSTASQAIKNNLRITEIMAKPDICTNQRKAEVILHRHLEHKAAEKVHNPERFKAKPNLGHLAAKNLLPSSQDDECFGSPSSGGTALKSCSSSTGSGAVVSFKEVKVRQPVKRRLVNY